MEIEERMNTASGEGRLFYYKGELYLNSYKRTIRIIVSTTSLIELVNLVIVFGSS